MDVTTTRLVLGVAGAAAILGAAVLLISRAAAAFANSNLQQLAG